MADRKKKIVGSVAVDSQTGMETYGVPKADSATTPVEQQPEFDPHAPTPNYGEAGSGMHAGKNIAGVPKEFLELFEHDPSEVIMMQTTHHPIGLAAIYGGTAIAIVLILVMFGVIVADSSFAESLGVSGGSVASLGGLLVILITSAVGLIGLVAGHVYRKSRLILTNQKVVYINYHSLISRQISQLNIGEVEDVSVIQPTLIHRIFKTGTITIETAGEQHNYNFTYAQAPHDFAHRTIQAHEGTIREYGN